MKNKLIYPLVVVVVAACGGGDDQVARQGQVGEYETVQEGSAAGVTSTIQGPGETLPPITGTNADTTTAFALNPANIAPGTQPATVAGTMPAPYPTGGMSPSYNPAAPVARPAQVQQQPAPRPMTSSGSMAAAQRPYQQPQQQQPPEQTQTTEPAPQPEPATEMAEPSTDTTATPPPPTNTAPPPKPEQPQEEPAEEEQEEAEEEPPPPPPPGRF